MATVSKEVYWQQIVENPSLYGSITTSDVMFNNQAECVWSVMGDSFIRRATNWEVSRWENMLGITASGTLTARKVAVLNRMTEQTPVTVRILNQLIKGVVGDDEYGFDYNNDTQTLNISIHKSYESAVSDLATRVIPASVEIVFEFTMLPNGFIVANFLESEGKSTITLPKCEYAEDVEIDFKPTKTAGYRPHIFDINQAGLYRQCFEVYNTKYAFLWGGTNAGMRTTNEVYAVNKRLKMRMDAKNKNIYINDVAVSHSSLFSVSPVEAANNFKLFVDSTICIFGSKIVFSDSSYEFVPALDANGKPCMYDLVSEQAFYNSGSQEFVVGLTVEQACKLSKLPNSGGALTISLPSSIVSGGVITDTAVDSAVNTAKGNGWVITVKTYEETATAAASTFGFRRIWVRKTQDANGSYVDADGIRWQVDWCVTMYTPDDSTPDQHGYELFRSVEAATEYWGLTPYVDPAW